MSENKRYRVFKYVDYEGYGVSDDIAEYTLATFDNHIEAECLCDRLNEQEERIKELENKLNQTALEFLNHAIISMGKAVEISEMSYHDFIKYRAEQGNPMELQL